MFEHDFGGSIKMRLPVQVKCCKQNLDICNICNQKPIGDYWHLNNRKFLCRSCMIIERRKHQRQKNEKLKYYHVIKNYFNSIIKFHHFNTFKYLIILYPLSSILFHIILFFFLYILRKYVIVHGSIHTKELTLKYG